MLVNSACNELKIHKNIGSQLETGTIGFVGKTQLNKMPQIFPLTVL